MLGRKAEHQNLAASSSKTASAKRKWQVEQEISEEDDDDASSESLNPEAELEKAALEADKAAKASKSQKAAPAVASAPSAGCEIAAGAPVGNAEEVDKKKNAPAAEDDEASDDDEGGAKGKAFAWMDSDDEVSEAEEGAVVLEVKTETGGARRTAAKTDAGGNVAAVASASATKAPVRAGLAAAEMRRLQTPVLTVAAPGSRPGLPALRPPPILPPGCRLPKLTQAHMALMDQIGLVRTVDGLWDVIDAHAETFAAAHAATSLQRLSLLTGTSAASSSDQKPEKIGAFVKLSERIDELLATAEGRASFLPADLAMVVSALAKVVQMPLSPGAVSRIFADVADEAETRIAAEPAAFTPPMLGDLVWGISRTGDTTANGQTKATPSFGIRRFLGSVMEVVVEKVPEMTCQDLANFAAAYSDTIGEDRDYFLRNIFRQVKLRLLYQPPVTNAVGPLVKAAAAATAAAPSVVSPPTAAATVTAPAVVVGASLSQSAPAVSDKDPSAEFLRSLEADTGCIFVADTPAAENAIVERKTVDDKGSETALDLTADTSRVDSQRNGGGEGKSQEPDRRPVWQLMGQWKFSGAQISEIVTAVARHINIYEPELFDVIAKTFLLRLQEFTTDQLKKVRDAFDVVRHDKNFDFHRNLTMCLKQRQTRRPCQAWRRGTCQFGERCLYSHED